MAKQREREAYQRLEDRAARGDYDLVPLDYLILDHMLPEGTTFSGGLYDLGTTAKELSKIFKQLPPTQITARVRSLHVQGLAVKVTMLNAEIGGRGVRQKGTAWQATKAAQKLLASEKGKKILANWKGQNGNQN